MTDRMMTACCSFVLSMAGTYLLAKYLRRNAIVAQPNERSLHAVPTPQGGGLPIFLSFALYSQLLPQAGGADSSLWTGQGYLLWAGLGLLLLSQLDDLFDLPALPRFAAQIVAVVYCALYQKGLVFQGIFDPFWDGVFAMVAWLWFINLFNFMDGMDGLAGGEAASIALGLFLLPPGDPAMLVLFAAVAGFLVWNWHPARIFLGDAGSVPLGFLLGGLLLQLAAAGHWIEALLLPLYFLADASITLGLRILRHERIWQAHRQHFYQRAAVGGISHRRIAGTVILVNAFLVFLAVYMAPLSGWMALCAGLGAVALLLLWMHMKARRRT